MSGDMHIKPDTASDAVNLQRPHVVNDMSDSAAPRLPSSTTLHVPLQCAAATREPPSHLGCSVLRSVGWLDSRVVSRACLAARRKTKDALHFDSRRRRLVYVQIPCTEYRFSRRRRHDRME